MIKRCSIIVFTFLFTVSFFLIPVSAESYSEGFFELNSIYDYQEDLNFYIVDGSFYIDLEFPSPTTVRYFECIVYTYNTSVSADIIIGDYTYQMNVDNIGQRTYRCYLGNIPSLYADYITLRFTGNNPKYQFTLLSADYSSVLQSLTSLPFSVNYANYGHKFYGSSGISDAVNYSVSAGEGLSLPRAPGTGANLNYGFQFYNYLSSSYWSKYDKLLLRLNLKAEAIKDISVYLGSSPVPFELNYLNNTNINNDLNVDDSSQEFSDVLVPSSFQHLLILIDLEDINRSLTDQLAVQISGNYVVNSVDNVSLGYIYGFYGVNYAVYPDLEVVWYRRLLSSIRNGFQELISVFNPQQPEVDSAISYADQAITDIHDMEQQYAADLDSSVITGEVSKVENYGNALVFCGSVLSRTFTQLQGYQIIYILPICVGLFLFVASRARPIHVPRQHSAPKANDTQVLDNKEG